MPACHSLSLSQVRTSSDVAISAWPGYTADADLYGEIADALAELADESPDALELLRGRTFARTLQ